jgi:hypothetical protein
MHATQVHLSALRASACGIPASTLLSVDHDKAYWLIRCVYRAPCTLTQGRAPAKERVKRGENWRALRSGVLSAIALFRTIDHVCLNS